jgi:hypothetical protein
VTVSRRTDWQQVILLVTLFCGVVGGLLAIVLYSVFLEVDWWWAVLALIAGTGTGTGLAFYILTAEPGQRPSQTLPPWTPTAQPGATRTSGAGYGGAGYGGAGYGTVQPGRHRQPAGQQSVPQAPPSTEPAKLVLPLAGPDASGSPPRQWWNERRAAGAAPPGTAAGAAPSSTAAGAAPLGTAAGAAPLGAGQADRNEASPGRAIPAPPLSSYDATSALIAQCPRCGEFRLDVSARPPGYAFRCVAGCGNSWVWTPGTPWPPVVVRRNLSGGRSVAENGGTEQQREPWN